MAEGARRLAQKIGSVAPWLAVKVKGRGAAMYDPRGKVTVGLGYALAAHGADHMVAAHDTMFVKRGAYALDRIAPLGLLDPVDLRDLGQAKVRHFATLEIWWDTLKSLGMAGERANVQARLFNCREGLGAADDRLPVRFTQDAAGGHPGIDEAVLRGPGACTMSCGAGTARPGGPCRPLCSGWGWKCLRGWAGGRRPPVCIASACCRQGAVAL